MWYRRRIAVDMETGEQYPVFMGVSDFDDSLSPTVFFDYFDDVPILDTATQCLDTLDLTEFVDDIQEEKREENIGCLPMDEGQAIGGVGTNPKSRKKEGEKEWHEIDIYKISGKKKIATEENLYVL